MVTDADLAVRLIAAGALGGFIGIERELRDQPAGFRTHILVALGSCLFTIIGGYGFAAFTNGGNNAVSVDFTRIASQIVVGIGFLGGGTILRDGMTVRGLTTAASLWVTAAVGMGVGIGMYFLATIASLVAVFSLAFLKPLEKFFTGVRSHQKRNEPPSPMSPD